MKLYNLKIELSENFKNTAYIRQDISFAKLLKIVT